MDYFYEGIQRLDWGFGNPNKTAAFIALLVVTFWAAGVAWKRAFWLMMPIAAIFTVFLLQTISRGGLVAAIAGVLAVFLVIRPRWQWQHWLTIGCMMIGLWLYSDSLGVADRYVQGLGTGEEDRSLSNRWLIYRAVPQMLIDAPQGWGAGNASEAYQQWYQPIGRGETYLNLVNSHFTWMVEWSTWKRVLYCIGWLAVVVISYPVRGRSWWVINFGIWVTFFIASAFSSVAHHPWMWPLPLVSLSAILVDRLFFKKGLSKKFYAYLIAGTSTVGALSYLLLISSSIVLPKQAEVTYNQKAVTVGDHSARKQVIIIGSDQAVLGKTLGHRLRSYVDENGDVALIWRESLSLQQADLPSIHLVIVAGDVIEKVKPEYLPKDTPLLLLNPTLHPAWIADHNGGIEVLWGDFHTSYAWYSWQHFAKTNEHVKLTKLLGEGTYLESWLTHIH